MYTAGIDEAGRGPLAGPVIAGAVIMPDADQLVGLKDSKKLSEKQREALYEIIVVNSIAWGVGRAEPEEIDKLNIHHATLLAMKRAYESLEVEATTTLIDGKFCPELECETQAIIKGDATVPVISAAAIIAKVTRDREMRRYHEQYPAYAFDRHKGYGTKAHIAAIQEHGITPIHRKSFTPCCEAVSSRPPSRDLEN